MREGDEGEKREFGRLKRPVEEAELVVMVEVVVVGGWFHDCVWLTGCAVWEEINFGFSGVVSAVDGTQQSGQGTRLS